MFKLSFILPVILSLILFIPGFRDLQTKAEPMTVCHSFPNDDMRQFSLDPEFQALHQGLNRRCSGDEPADLGWPPTGPAAPRRQHSKPGLTRATCANLRRGGTPRGPFLPASAEHRVA